MVRRDKLEKLWQKHQAREIAAAGHTATIYYHRQLVSSGAGVDTFFGENIDGRDPYDGIVDSGIPPLELDGKVSTGFSGNRSVREKEEFLPSPFGRVQPNDRIFKMLFDALPADALLNVKYIKLSTDPGNEYRLVGSHPAGMMNHYTLHILMRNSEDADLTGP